MKVVDKQLKKSIDIAFVRIKKFHSKQKFSSFKYKDKFKNELSYRFSPIDRVGVYVPGGTASYPSTVLMNCIPALVAGVKNIYLTTPAYGSQVNPAIIYAAKKCGVKEIYKTGGAQSIAALSYGTKTFKKVDKIVGPGNAFVAAAKKEVFGDVGIDMVAGPSEVSIIADKFSNPSWILLTREAKQLATSFFGILKCLFSEAFVPETSMAAVTLVCYGPAMNGAKTTFHTMFANHLAFALFLSMILHLLRIELPWTHFARPVHLTGLGVAVVSRFCVAYLA